jgi:NitT/TauT family transport system permease protein
VSVSAVAAREKLARGAPGSRHAMGLAPLAGIAVGLLAWWLAAEFLLRFLPTPVTTFRTFVEQVMSPEFLPNFSVTARRVAIGTLGAFLVGSAIGVAMGRLWVVDSALHPWVFVGLALPGPLVVLFAILAMGLGELTALVALWTVVTPFVVTLAYGGAKAIDPELIEMSRSYRFSSLQRLRHVIAPQMLPSLMSGLRVGFAMSWKLVVLIEALSSTNGIGERIHFFFTFNQPAAVLAWTFSFTIVMVLVEILLFQTLDRRLFAWRPKARL